MYPIPRSIKLYSIGSLLGIVLSKKPAIGLEFLNNSFSKIFKFNYSLSVVPKFICLHNGQLSLELLSTILFKHSIQN